MSLFAAHDRPFVFKGITFQPVDQKKADAVSKIKVIEEQIAALKK